MYKDATGTEKVTTLAAIEGTEAVDTKRENYFQLN